MIKLRKIAMDILYMLTNLGVDDAECTITEQSTDETNSLGKSVYLLREFDSIKIDFKIVKSGASAQMSINQFDTKSLQSATKLCVSMLDNQKSYKPYTIGYKEEIEPDIILDMKRDPEKLYFRFAEFMDTLKNDYPTISSDAMASYVDTKKLYLNTLGQEICSHTQRCDFGWQGNATDYKSTTDCNFFHVGNLDLNMPFIEQGMVKQALDKTLKMLNPRPIGKGSFIGTIVLEPDMLPYYAYQIIDRIKNMKDNDGLPIPQFSSNISIFEAHSDKEFLSNEDVQNSEQAEVTYFVSNGEIQTRPEDSMTDEEKAVYFSTKQKKYQILNKKVFGLKGGNVPYEKLIKNIKQGLLIGSIIGTQGSPNGEFSGVAKNSLYIEDGEIKFPVIETMVSGNVFEMFNNVKDISQETVADNGTISPWISFDGISII